MSRYMHVFVPVYAYVCTQRYSNTVVFFSFAVLSLQNSSCFAVCLFVQLFHLFSSSKIYVILHLLLNMMRRKPCRSPPIMHPALPLTVSAKMATTDGNCRTGNYKCGLYRLLQRGATSHILLLATLQAGRYQQHTFAVVRQFLRSVSASSTTGRHVKTVDDLSLRKEGTMSSCTLQVKVGFSSWC